MRRRYIFVFCTLIGLIAAGICIASDSRAHLGAQANSELQSKRRGNNTDSSTSKWQQKRSDVIPDDRPIAPALASGSPSVEWHSLNAGGAVATVSPGFQLGSSLGQSIAGNATSASNDLGIGFWYGVRNCSCPFQGDIYADGVIDVFDVIAVIGIAFSGQYSPRDATCPTERADCNNDSIVDVFDVIYLIATAFGGGPSPVNPCGL